MSTLAIQIISFKEASHLKFSEIDKIMLNKTEPFTSYFASNILIFSFLK